MDRCDLNENISLSTSSDSLAMDTSTNRRLSNSRVGSNSVSHSTTDKSRSRSNSRGSTISKSGSFSAGSKTHSAADHQNHPVDVEYIKNMARKLLRDIVIYMALPNRAPHPINEHAKTLRRTVDQISERHKILFASMVRKLRIGDPDSSCESFKRIADEVFIDGHYNWGRVVTLFAFAGWLAKHCVERKLSEEWVEKIAEVGGDYIAENLTEWIGRQGGWDDLDRFFPDEHDTESKIWKGLFYTMIGLGALATTFAAVR